MKKLLLSLALLCVAVGTVQAQGVYQWFGGEPANSDWNYGMNWKEEFTNTFGTVPDTSAKVKINNVQWGSIAEPYIGGANGTQSIVIGDIFICEAGAALSPDTLHVGVGGSLLVQGDTALAAAGQINIGYQSGAVGGLDVAGGTVNVNGPLHAGWGGQGTVVISGGGLLSVQAYDIGGAGGTGLIDVQNGQFRIDGFVVEQVQADIDNGRIVCSTGTIQVTFDELAEETVVTPEPISIALLGLGALFMRKRS